MSPDREQIDSSPRFSVLRAALVLVVFAVGVVVLVAFGARPSVSTPSPTTFPETGSTPTTAATNPTTAPSTTTTAPTTRTTAPSTSSGTGRGSHRHTPASTTTPTVAAPGSVSVVVANGTHTTGLAAHFSSVLGNSGWSMKAPTNTTTPATTSAVYYATSQQAAANEIANALGVKKSQVLPMTSSVPVPAVTGIDVVVVIGQDLAGAGAGAGA